MAIWALERENEVEFLKILSVISAIITVGNNMAAALTGQNSPGGDNLSKLIDNLQELMMPHRKELMEKKVEKYREIMLEEQKRGELKIHAVDVGKPRKRKRSNRAR